MTGDWLARIARGLIHQSTFALVVEPAIADLQFEAPAQSRCARLSAYSSVWVALGGAVWYDLIWDRRRPPWAETASVFLTLMFVVASYHLAMMTLVLGFDRRVTRSTGTLGRFVANVVGTWSVPMLFLLFVLAALFVAAAAHEAARPERTGTVEG